ncbi:MAG: hypothetical protein HOV81_16910 [Kofleriaceae bacterium]|nr:hypothetical protein [Kofleriaceae bacterium]
MRGALLAMIAIGCGQPTTSTQTTPAPQAAAAPDAAPAEPVPLDEDLPRLADRAVQLYAEWARAFSEAGTDCTLATSRMNEIAERYADVIVANQRIMRAGHQKIVAMREAMKKHEAENDAAAKAIMEGPTMSKCASDPAFSKAVDRLAGEG